QREPMWRSLRVQLGAVLLYKLRQPRNLALEIFVLGGNRFGFTRRILRGSEKYGDQAEDSRGTNAETPEKSHVHQSLPLPGAKLRRVSKYRVLGTEYWVPSTGYRVL